MLFKYLTKIIKAGYQRTTKNVDFSIINIAINLKRVFSLLKSLRLFSAPSCSINTYPYFIVSFFRHLIVFLLFRDEMFRKSISHLKADIVQANSLVQEANYLSEEMSRQTKFSVTLQIPPANLSPNRKVHLYSIVYMDRFLCYLKKQYFICIICLFHWMYLNVFQIIKVIS